jgi:hypothetical protein
MREINKTIYDILKKSDPSDDISVTQLITDEVVKQTIKDDIEIVDRTEVTGVLDIKALNLTEKEKPEGTNTALRRQIKASGKKQRSSTEKEGESSMATKKSGSTAKRTIKRKKAPSKTKKLAPSKEGGDMFKIVLVLIVMGVAGYFYMQMS